MQALNKVKNTQFDLAIVDYQIPGMNGIELIKEIREYERQNALIPMTILCTSFY
jgi:CheY-like chemotaxis protein